MQPVRLERLLVENLVMIERAEMMPSGAVTVITGETGAGKTLLTRGLDLLLGGRADRTSVRPGARHAHVEATFTFDPQMMSEVASDVAEMFDSADQVTIARRIAAEGRSRCYIDGHVCTLEALKAIAGLLVQFCGQHEQRSLMLAETQTTILDSSGDGLGAELLGRYREHLAKLRKVTRLIANLTSDREAERTLDLLRFERDELLDAAPQPGEVSELTVRHRQLQAAVAGQQANGRASQMLANEDNGALTLIGQAVTALTSVDPGQAKRLRLIADDLEAVVAEIVPSDADADAELTATTARLDLLGRLALKHHRDADTLDEVLASHQQQVADLEARPEKLRKAQLLRKRVREDLLEASTKLTDWRTSQASALSQQITAQLDALAMQGSSFHVQLRTLAEPSDHGAEQVVFCVEHPGMEAQPISDILSGGETSRLLIALLSATGADDSRLLVLDEPDAGLGGNVAHEVARHLRQIADTRHVLTISHLPQLAGRADCHWQLSKHVGQDEAKTTLRHLADEADRLDELCRMAGTDPADPAARATASAMLAA